MFNHSASLEVSTSTLKTLPGKLDIKRRSLSILYVLYCFVGSKLCPPLKAPRNGNVIHESRAIDGKATFRCDQGYILDPDNAKERFCYPGRKWGGEQPVCRSKFIDNRTNRRQTKALIRQRWCACWSDGSAVAQWQSAWLETERPRVRASPASLRCSPWARHINPSLVLVKPRKTRPCLTERLLMGRKGSNQTNKHTKGPTDLSWGTQ